jgi:hypothetical protein
MTGKLSIADRLEKAVRRKRRAEAFALQDLEGNPLTADEKAMFEMFDREGWSDERRRAYILAQFAGKPDLRAAE